MRPAPVKLYPEDLSSSDLPRFTCQSFDVRIGAKPAVPVRDFGLFSRTRTFQFPRTT
ncbi:Hypothetical protein RY67_1893 [Bifidobacterium longum subsp. infantis]|uniref:Uncharacterized protein n=1 Tax=Bifidobacterium longum subsp. infantis TaxID=1682 RepID=A0A0M3T6G0_BIFLI|nr:Hypothetical protein RY67_1893 [Bifidobacterium longum subsp. infantis]